jgi:ubiquinone/menaquinone biosynthesis C-methylase UbiE
MGLVTPEYIKVNNEITHKTLADRETEGVMESHMIRYNEEYQMFCEYVKPHHRILDLGCKDGLWFDLLSAYGYNNLVGVDCSPVVAEMAGKKGYDIYIGDICDLSMFEANEFDAISIIHTLEHVPEPSNVVEECWRVLKEGGYVFVEVPTQEYAPPEEWGHYHCFYNKQEVVDLFDREFELIEQVSQPTKSKSPWHRYIFKIRGDL